MLEDDEPLVDRDDEEDEPVYRDYDDEDDDEDDGPHDQPRDLTPYRRFNNGDVVLVVRALYNDEDREDEEGCFGSYYVGDEGVVRDATPRETEFYVDDDERPVVAIRVDFVDGSDYSVAVDELSLVAPLDGQEPGLFT